MKIDLGCGTRKQVGFLGIDAQPFEGVDLVADLRHPWPWLDGEVEEVFSSHFVEHLTNAERMHFWNELFRVLKVGGKASIIVPHWSHACAYGDPTHQWPPMSEWAAYYLNKAWRETNAPHVPLTCDFDFVVGGSWDEWLTVRKDKEFPMARYVNSWRDLHITLTKRG